MTRVRGRAPLPFFPTPCTLRRPDPGSRRSDRIVDRPLADHLGEQKIASTARLRWPRALRADQASEAAGAQVGLLEAEAAPIAIGQRRSKAGMPGARTAALDGLDQDLAVDGICAQIGARPASGCPSCGRRRPSRGRPGSCPSAGTSRRPAAMSIPRTGRARPQLAASCRRPTRPARLAPLPHHPVLVVISASVLLA